MLRDGAAGAAALFETLAQEAPDDPCVAFHLRRIQHGVTGVSVIMAEK